MCKEEPTKTSILPIIVVIIVLMGTLHGYDRSSPLIIDHNCTNLDTIPEAWIDSVQSIVNFHYAHTSHGSQVTTGLERIEDSDSTYDHNHGLSYLPETSVALSIFDGQEGDTYITPEEYWQTSSGMNNTRTVLDNNPEINFSMWSWCTQLHTYDSSQLQEYIDSMQVLEAEYPEVTFIYMTCTSDHTYPIDQGYNRWLRNEEIRNFCVSNDKVLFDFAEIEQWHDGEHYTETYDTSDVPREHSYYWGSEAGHTSYLNCEKKGRAFWWMLARLVGWEGEVKIEPRKPDSTSEMTISPNPFRNKCKIELREPKTVKIFDLSGNMVVEKYGRNIRWEPSHSLSSGVYILKSSQGQIGRILFLK